MGLRLRVILIIAIPALVATAVHGVIRVRQQEPQLVAEEQQNLALTARAVQIAVENAVAGRQWEDVHYLVSQMVEQQDAIDRIRLFDRHATLTFASDPVKSHDVAPTEVLRRVIDSGVSEASYKRRANQSIIAIVVPVRGRFGRIDGAMEVVRVAAGIDRRVRAAIIDIIVRFGILLVVTTSVTAAVLQRQMLRPLGRLAAGIQRLGRGETGIALAVERRDELGRLAQAFNDMAAGLHEARRQLLAESERALVLEQQARQANALAVAGKLTVALAHEVGTPLNIISARAEFLLRDLPAGDARRDDLQAIVTQIDRISRIITSLLDVVRPQAPKLEPISVAVVARDLLPLLKVAARQRHITLRYAEDDHLPIVRGDTGQLQQVVLNLVVNALEATRMDGQVDVEVRAMSRDGRHGVGLVVTDTGPGIAPDLQSKIFEAFFTTKPRGQGTGLGLAISRDIVRAHGGDIAVANVPGGGAAFTVWLAAAIA